MPRSLPRCCEWHGWLFRFCRNGQHDEWRREWIEGVKRRLGLIGPDDDAAARLAQWEHDHLTADDLPAALSAGARELDGGLTLELGREVPELRADPSPAGDASWKYWPPAWPEPTRAYLSSGYLWGQM